MVVVLGRSSGARSCVRILSTRPIPVIIDDPSLTVPPRLHLQEINMRNLSMPTLVCTLLFFMLFNGKVVPSMVEPASYK